MSDPLGGPPSSGGGGEVRREPAAGALARAKRHRVLPAMVPPTHHLGALIRARVLHHPAAAVAACLGAGFLLGLCIPRRRDRG